MLLGTFQKIPFVQTFLVMKVFIFYEIPVMLPIFNVDSTSKKWLILSLTCAIYLAGY